MTSMWTVAQTEGKEVCSLMTSTQAWLQTLAACRRVQVGVGSLRFNTARKQEHYIMSTLMNPWEVCCLKSCRPATKCMHWSTLW